MYHIADIALVTPLRDGKNLVAKEYLAVKRDAPSVLILSEMAGAAIELGEAIIVNPNDVGEIEHAILKALEMPVDEQLRKLRLMQEVISKQTVDKWATDFVHQIKKIKLLNEALYRKRIKGTLFKQMQTKYRDAGKRLLILDYDGTLCAFKSNPEDVGNYYIQLFDSTLANWIGEQPGVCTMAKNCGHAGVMEYNGDVYSCDRFVFTATGEPGLNYLCKGYHKFFKHVAPYIDFMKKELLNDRPPANIRE